MSRLGNLFIVNAPSGTGKTSLVQSLISSNTNLYTTISYTTRVQREGELEGKDYFFIEQEEFFSMVEKNMFLEHACVYGNYYGTAKKQVDNHLSCGDDVVLEIDSQGAKKVKSLFPDSLLIGIVPPSIDDLLERLKSRGKDSEAVIRKRMDTAKYDIKNQQDLKADYLVVNDNFDTALINLQSIVAVSRFRGCINKFIYNDLLK